MVLPSKLRSRAGGTETLTGVSFIGLINLTDIFIPFSELRRPKKVFVERFSPALEFLSAGSNRIGDHFAAARPGDPTTDHGGKFPSSPARHDDANGLRRTELLITTVAIDQDLLEFCHHLAAFGIGSTLIGAQRHAGVLEQEVARLLLAPARAMNGLRMLRAKNDQRFRSEAQAIGPDGAKGVGNRLQDLLRGSCGVLTDAVRRFSGKQRQSALLAVKSALDVERLPRIGLFVLGDAVTELAGIPECRHIDASG